MGFYYILLVNFLIVLRFSTSFIIATLISQDSHTSTSVSLESAFDTIQADQHYVCDFDCESVLCSEDEDKG